VLRLQHLELEEVVNLAKEVGGAHHGFLAIQTPINLKMNEAYTQKWQRVINKTATAAAEKAAKEAADAAAKAAAAAAAAAKAAAEAAAEEAGTPLPDGSPPPPSSPPPPPLAHIVVHNKVSLADAAVDLGIQLFGSAPLNEVRPLPLPRSIAMPLERCYIKRRGSTSTSWFWGVGQAVSGALFARSLTTLTWQVCLPLTRHVSCAMLCCAMHQGQCKSVIHVLCCRVGCCRA
jgi:hypothetical protein